MLVIVGTPRQPVTLDTAEEDEEASASHQGGIKLSELEFSVFGDYAVVPSVEVILTMLLCTCLLLYGVEIATSSISYKTTTTSITRGVGVISRSEWTHLPSQPGSIPGQSVLWGE